MKSIFIFILFAVLSSNSFASAQFVAGNLNSNLPEPTPLTEPTIYDRIMEKFNNGTLPEFTSSIGWWSGRCYSKDSPNSPKSKLLAIAENTLVGSPDNGPDFPPVTQLLRNMGFIFWSGNSNPGFFDEMTDEVRSSVTFLLRSDEFKGYIIQDTNGSMSVAVGSVRHTIRKFGENFYGHISSVKDGQETISEVCYFFKKVD